MASAQISTASTGLVRHGLTINGSNRIEGSMQILTGENVTLNGSPVITGDLLVPGTPTISFNGNPSYGGTLQGTGSAQPTNYSIIGNGTFSLRHVIRRTNPISLPAVPAPPQPSGTRDVTLTNATQNPGNYATIRNLTLNGSTGNLTVPPGTYGQFTINGNNSVTIGVAGATQPSVYNFQKLLFNGGNELRVVGPVIVTVNGGVTANGKFGSSPNPAWLKLRLATGEFVLNGGKSVYGEVLVPAGTVRFNGNCQLVGSLMCDRLVLNGNNLLRFLVLNSPPVAADQLLNVMQDTPRSVVLSGSDADGQSLSYTLLSQPAHGTLSGVAPNLTYAPASNYHGPDSFTFKANDGQVDSNVATVSITITRLNHAPVANPSALTLNQNTSAPDVLTGSDVDGDQLTFRVTSVPAHGALSGSPPNLVYTPSPNFHGTDSFAFVANDGALDSSPATVSITVNHPPVAEGQDVQTNENTAVAILLTATDPDSEALTYTVIAQPAHGVLSGAPPNLTYTPAAGFFGSDNFTFRADDGSASSAAATVQIAVVHVNRPPTANGQNVSLDEDETAAILLTGNDLDGDALTFAIAVQPEHGTLSGTPPNLVYTPSPNYFGDDSFAFRANDGAANSQDGVVNLTVRPVNDAPSVRLSSPASGAEFDAGDTVPITATASDQDGSIATFRLLLDGAVVSETLQASTAAFDLLDVAAGDHSISAVVIDNDGASAASVQIPITVRSQGNGPVQVNAGPDRLISLPAAARLDGSVTVNGAPAGANVQLAWQKISGPGSAPFSDPSALQPTVNFDVPGNYVLKLVATAPEGTGFDTVKVTVLAAPQAGPDSPVSNKGREFWMAFLSGLPPSVEPDHAGAFLFISSEVAATGKAEITYGYYVDGVRQSYTAVENFAVAAGGKTVVEVDGFWQPVYDDNQFDKASPTSVHIIADAPVAVHALSSSDASTDGSLILPTGMLGHDYFIMSYNNSLTFHPNSQNVIGGTQLAVVAAHDGTQVTITPTASTAAHPAGQTFTVTLQRGDVYRMINKTDVAGDFTGTSVQSNKPVAVFGGHACATVPGSTAACDHLYEQMTPVDFWGRHFVTLPLATRQNGDRFRVLAANDNTSVSINGQIVAILDRGQFHETVLAEPASIVADQRILLAQFAHSSAVDNTTGDPFMALVPPYEEFGRHYILSTQALHSYYHGGSRDIFDSYLSVVVDSVHAGSVTVNGQAIASSQFVPIGESGFSGATISLAKDSTFDISSPTPIGTWIYGWASYESYGFTGGLYAELDAGSADFQLTQSSSAAPIGATHRVRAHFNNAASLPVPGARVDFVVTGANPATGFGYTAADGTLEFSWVGAQAGTDTVTATAGAFTATASVAWLSNPSNQPPHVDAGADRVVKLGDPVILQGLAQDDGLPAGGQMVLQWSALPGAGDVTFSDPASATTTATFVYPGQYHLRLTAYDGQFSGEDELGVNVDIPPEFFSLETSPLLVDLGKEWSVFVSARDLDGTIVSVELLEGSQVLARHEQNDPQVHFLTLATVFTTLGQHSIIVRLTDNLGVTTDRSFEVTVRPAPTVQILSPADNTTIPAGGSALFTASASSAGGAITRVVYEDVTDYPWELGEGAGSNYQFTWTPNSAGTRLIAATAYDSNGASGTSAPVTITVESAGDPTIAIIAPSNGSSVYRGETVTFRVEASANAPAQVSDVSFYEGNRYLGTTSSPPYEVQWSATSSGSRTLRARVWDTFGGSATTSITVNVIPVPDLSVTLVQPEPNIPIKVNSPITLAASIENVIGELYAVEFYVNGAWIGDGLSTSATWTPTAIGEYQVLVRAYSSNPAQEGYGDGLITVADLHAPVVEFTAPTNNLSFLPGTPIVLQAQASDLDSNLANLQFLADGQLLSETPFSGGVGVASFTWDNAGPGWHALTARAVDDTIQTGNAFLRVFVERLVANDLLPPSALTSETISANGIRLTWTPSASSTATATAIERRAGITGTWEEIATVDSTVAIYEDNALEPEHYYSYRLASLNATGARSIYSEESSATTLVQLPQYAVVDLGESLEQSLVALQLLEKRFLYAQAGGTIPSAALLDLRDAEVMSIGENNDVLLKQRATTSNGQTTIEYYLLWHPDPNKPPDSIGDPNFRAFRLTRDGIVAGAMDHSTVGQGVPDWIYRGFEFWLGVGSRPGVVRDGGGRIDVRAATWTPAGGVNEVSREEVNEYRFDRLDLNPARKFPKPYDSLFSAWDISSDGIVVGTGSWGDLRSISSTTSLDDIPSYEFYTLQHGMRWKNNNWDTLGSLRRESATEGESIATAISPDGTVVVGGSAAPDRANDPPSPTHAMRSVMSFSASQSTPGDPFLKDLAPLGNGSYAWAWDVDASGNAVGYSTKGQADPITRTHAVLWQSISTAPLELPNLGGRNTTHFPEGYGYANAINATGNRIVGKSITTDGFTAGTVWALNANNGGNSRSWEVHDLNAHVPSDWFVVNALDVNNKGFIVGTAFHTVPNPANPQGPPIQVRRGVLLIPVEFLEVTPKTKDDAGNDITNSEKPKPRPKSNELVEEPRPNQIPNVAYRNLKVRIPHSTAGDKIKWSMVPLFTPAGQAGPRFRGQWPQEHPNRFEANAGSGGSYGFESLSEEEARTHVDANGETAIRINVPPIGFNKADVRLEIEKYPGATAAIIFEVSAVVVIDPGHGGDRVVGGSSPNNAVSYGDSQGNKTLEKNLTRIFGIQLRDRFNELRDQEQIMLRVFLTRSTDINIGIANRAHVARDNGADTFLSIHFNGSTNATIHGPETLMEPMGSGNANYDEDHKFARRIQAALDQSVPRAQQPGTPGYRDIKENTNSDVYRDFNLGNRANLPNSRACLAEIDWITNPAIEMDIISGTNAATNQAAIVRALGDAVMEDLRSQP